MTLLEKMIESCAEFAKNPKIGGVEFLPKIKDNGEICGFVSSSTCVWISIDLDNTLNKFILFARPLVYTKTLTATTAQEAAAEALELCRKEAQKLVELLSEPKEIVPTIEEIQKESERFQIASIGKTANERVAFSQGAMWIRSIIIK